MVSDTGPAGDWNALAEPVRTVAGSYLGANAEVVSRPDAARLDEAYHLIFAVKPIVHVVASADQKDEPGRHFGLADLAGGAPLVGHVVATILGGNV